MKVIYVYNGIKFGNGTLTCLPRECDYIKIDNNIYIVSAVMFEWTITNEMVAVIYLKDTHAFVQTELKYI